MRPVALQGTEVTPEAIDGAVLAHTIKTEDERPIVLAKGRILSRSDWPLLQRAGTPEVHLVRMDPGEIHEDEAARRLAALVAGDGIVIHGPVESQMRLAAETNGIVQVDVTTLEQLNGVPDVSVFTIFDGQLVSQGKTVAGVKVTPFVIPKARLKEAARVCGSRGVVRVRAFKAMRVAVLVREGLPAREREKLRSSIQMKVAWFGSRLVEVRYVADDVDEVARAIGDLAAASDLLLTAGANATDPLDSTLRALALAGARMEHQGAPAHPGSAVWLAYLGAIPIFGVAACGMFSRATVLDLLLPRLFTGAPLTARDFQGLGHGGLLSREMGFRFPSYVESDTIDP